MTKKELIGKLTTAHFAQGDNFDKAAFASLVKALRKRAGNMWKCYFIPFAMLAGGVYLLTTLGSRGYISMPILGALSAILSLLSLFTGYSLKRRYSKPAVSVYKTLGITQRDVDTALHRIRQATNNAHLEYPDQRRRLFATCFWFGTVILGLLIYIASSKDFFTGFFAFHDLDYERQGRAYDWMRIAFCTVPAIWMFAAIKSKSSAATLWKTLFWICCFTGGIMSIFQHRAGWNYTHTIHMMVTGEHTYGPVANVITSLITYPFFYAMFSALGGIITVTAILKLTELFGKKR